MGKFDAVKGKHVTKSQCKFCFQTNAYQEQSRPIHRDSHYPYKQLKTSKCWDKPSQSLPTRYINILESIIVR